ncbi:hypothetical protein J4E89_009564 [Alternaria sp. Ai002NY15]|nr:hypothetical protein J4E89_009564 [Alternaria sp. Ai002NY15]
MKPVQSINHSDTLGLVGSHLERMNDHASTLPAILRLPRELRDLIYEHYVQVDGGYIHNFETNRLLQADGSPISTGLALTCRQIAAEMQGLALEQNTITFSTHFSESSRQQAGLFHMTMYTIMFRKKIQLQHLIPRLLSYDMVQRAIDAYPQFAQVFDGWTPHQAIVALHKPDIDCGEAPSTWDDFIQYVFHLLSKHPAFHDEAQRMPRIWIPGEDCDVGALSETSPAPWLIPDLPELDRLTSIADVEPRPPTPTPEHTSTVFKIVQRDVAWQSALDAAYARGLLPTPSWYERRTRVGYQYEGLPAAIRDMSTDGGPISCNFDIGQSDNVESLLALHRGWTHKQWVDHWGWHQPQSFQTEDPLPPWHVLKWLRVML